MAQRQMVLIRLARQPPELAQAIQARTIQKRAIQLQVIQIHAQAESQALERALVLKLLARQEQQVSARRPVAERMLVLKLKARREFGAAAALPALVRPEKKKRLGM